MSCVKRGALVLVLACALVAVSTDARGDAIGPVPYLQSSDSPFSGVTFTYFWLEDFEDGALNTPGVSLTESGTRVIPRHTYSDSVDGDDGAVDGYGQQGRALHSNLATTTLTFVFNTTTLGSLPTHAGAVITDVWSPTPDQVVATAYGVGGSTLGTLTLATFGDASAQGTTAEDRFMGFTYAAGISSISFAMSSSIDWELDHLQYGFAPGSSPIPEPTTIALLSLGAAGLAWRRRRMK